MKIKNYLLIFANKQIRLKYVLIVVGILFSSISHGQTRTDKELYATWKDKSKPETVRLEAIWERMNLDSMPNQEPIWWKKWKPEVKEAIELAIKNNRKGYLPLFYMSILEDCADNTECLCTTAHKIIESAKVANASKLPIIFAAYNILTFQCNENVKEEDVTNEFNKAKRFLLDNPAGLKNLREITLALGEWYGQKEKYPRALSYLFESLRLSEKLKSIDFTYARNNAALSGIHAQIGNYKEAEKYIDKSLQVAHSLKDTFQLGSAYLGKSDLMLKLKDEAKAQRYIDSAMYVMKNVKHCEPCYNIAKTLNAGIKNLSKNYAGALTELQEVEAFFKSKSGGQKPEPRFYTEKARAYVGLKKYNDAIQTLNAVKVSEQTYNKDVSDNYNILSKAYQGIGDYKNALKNYRLHVQTEDTLAVWRNSSETTRLELENQFTQQQLKSELDFQTQLNKQKSTRNWILFLGIVAGLIALGLFARLQYTRKTQILLQQKNEIIEAEKEKANTALNELKSTQNQLIQKEKLASLGELTAGIAHEIQNPLNFVNNFSELNIDLSQELKEEIDKVAIPEKDKEYIGEILGDLTQNQQKINHHGKRASSIVSGMLEHSRTSTGERALTDINKLADEYLRLSYHGIRAKDKNGSATRFNADYELITDKNLPLINVVPQDIGRVLLNLINNAFWAVRTVANPKVTISTLNDSIALSDGIVKKVVVIKVLDNGAGIPTDILPKIFQPFFTTKPTGEGTGLGLSLAYDIVTKGHGGTLEVESVEGEGTTFVVKLPISQG